MFYLVSKSVKKNIFQSEELEDLRPNVTEARLANLTSNLNCTSICSNLTTNLNSESLLILVSTASLAAFPKLANVLATPVKDNWLNVSDFEFDINYNYFNNSNYTLEENSTNYSTTPQYKTLEENILELKNAFQDYLSYILSNFNGEDVNDTSDFNFTG